ncbi:hypothetical protein A0H81_03507 [Grifola frondosa]|uniref:DUF6534 domain-containing protein n=1 Tax=Grifola frondosa TaxID=5627 RepID=A0A1C7MGT5_GRIFR|nr:hypothetical protein A0H81_03507 [Grifola frondosa]
MPSPIKLDNTLGAAFLGNIFAAVFYGITNVQTFTYYKIHVAIEGISDLIIRSFYCYRVWRLSKRSWILGIAIGMLTLLVFGTNLAIAVECYKVTSYFQLANIAWLLYLSFSAALVADFIVAVSLCWLLAKHRTGFKRTDSIIRVLMLYIINTCALTTIFAFCCLITFIRMPDNLIFIAFYFVIPKLFLNSFLAMLNSRTYVREIGSSAPVVSIPLPAMSGTRTTASADGAGGKSQPQYEDQVLQIQIQTTDMKSDSAAHIV